MVGAVCQNQDNDYIYVADADAGLWYSNSDIYKPVKKGL